MGYYTVRKTKNPCNNWDKSKNIVLSKKNSTQIQLVGFTQVQKQVNETLYCPGMYMEVVKL